MQDGRELQTKPTLKNVQMKDMSYIILSIVGAVLLYRLRRQKQFWYGAFEILVAFVVIYLAIKPPIMALTLDQGYSYLGYQLQQIYAVLAGVYIFVRGMDNIGNDLPDTWKARWNKVFPASHNRPPTA